MGRTIQEGLLKLMSQLNLQNQQNLRQIDAISNLINQAEFEGKTSSPSVADVNWLKERFKSIPQLKSVTGSGESTAASKYIIHKSDPKETVVQALKADLSFSHLFQQGTRSGPFILEDGDKVWLDFYQIVEHIQIWETGADAPVMYVTILKPLRSGITLGPVPNRSSSSYSLAKGTLWIRADKLSNATVAGQYIGFSLSGGSIRFEQRTSVSDHRIEIDADTPFTMDLNLSNPVPVFQEKEHGQDARDVRIRLPDQIRIATDTNHHYRLTSTQSIAVTAYKEDYEFSLDAHTATLENNTRTLGFKLKASEQKKFSIRKSLSQLVHMQGGAPVVQSLWVLNTRVITNHQPVALDNNGGIGIAAGEGLDFRWTGIERDQSARLHQPFYLFHTNGIIMIDKACNYGLLEEKYTLWKRKEADKERDTTMLLNFRTGSPLMYCSEAEGSEYFAAYANADFQIDKPFLADGRSVSPRTEQSIYIKRVDEDKNQVSLFDADLLDEEKLTDSEESEKDFAGSIFQFAIENAFLSTSSAGVINLKADFDQGNRLTNGLMYIYYKLYQLVPTLAHPYTTNAMSSRKLGRLPKQESYERMTDASIRNYLGALVSICTWDDQEHKFGTVDFRIVYDQKTQSNIQYESAGVNIMEHSGNLKGRQDLTLPAFRQMLSLFDVSTHSDLLGISLSPQSLLFPIEAKHEYPPEIIQLNEVTYIQANEVNIRQMNLQAPMTYLHGMTLPQVTWEPFKNLTPNAISNNPDDLDVGIYHQHNNPLPTVLSQSDRTPTKIDPLSFMDRFQKNLTLSDPGHSYPIHSSVFMSLPNGKFSYAELAKFNPQQQTFNRKHYQFIQPEFIENNREDQRLKGGVQWRIAAADRGGTYPPLLKGWTTQMNSLTNGQSPLGGSVHQIFQEVFFQPGNINGPKSKGVPLTHIDLSGYGASTFSNWLNPPAKYADIAQVKFDLLLGRLAHEIVEAATVIYPWGIAVTRTISFYKRNNAIIYREDSGWVAKSDGLFDFSYELPGNPDSTFVPNPYEIHPGHIQGLRNIRNIREIATDSHELAQGGKVIGVAFDADLEIEHISQGAVNGKVNGWQFRGYLQLAPSAEPLQIQDLRELFEINQNSISGNVDCTMQLASGQQQMQVKRVDMSYSFREDNPSQVIFAAAARGSVTLPGDGSWSIVEINEASGDVSPVTDKQNIPVYKIGRRKQDKAKFEIENPSSISNLTFIDTLLNNSLQYGYKNYGYVQNTGTQKLLLPAPSYQLGQPDKLLTKTSLIADSFSLLNSKGPFCNIFNAIKGEDVADAITEILPNGLKKILNRTITDRAEFNIIGEPGQAFRMYVAYDAGSQKTLLNYITDSASVADAWKNQMDNLSIKVDIGPFQPLMTISGDFSAGANIKAGIGAGTNAPQLKLAPALQKVYEILEFLNSIDITNPKNNVEAIKKGLQVFMSNNADTWEYKFKAEKEIPLVKFPFDPINYNSPTTPLKLDAFFRMGCYFNQPVSIPHTIDQVKPSIGAYLELGADLRVMCVSLAAATIYAVGRAEVGIAADMDTPPTLYFKFGFGVELCVGLPVIGSVAVTYMVGIDMSINAEIVKIGAFLYFRGRAEIFGGLVTVTIHIEAAGLIEKTGNKTNCIATCTFGLDICVAWVIDISFTETWEETRQIA